MINNRTSEYPFAWHTSLKGFIKDTSDHHCLLLACWEQSRLLSKRHWTLAWQSSNESVWFLSVLVECKFGNYTQRLPQQNFICKNPCSPNPLLNRLWSMIYRAEKPNDAWKFATKMTPVTPKTTSRTGRSFANPLTRLTNRRQTVTMRAAKTIEHLTRPVCLSVGDVIALH